MPMVINDASLVPGHEYGVPRSLDDFDGQLGRGCQVRELGGVCTVHSFLSVDYDY